MEIGKKRKQTKEKAQKKRKSTATTPSEMPQADTSSKPELWPGQFVALRLVKYDEEPQIAKVESLSEMDVVIQWWTGLYHDVWTEWKVRSKVVTECVPKNAIIKNGFELTRSNRLSAGLIKELKNLYRDIEFI